MQAIWIPGQRRQQERDLDPIQMDQCADYARTRFTEEVSPFGASSGFHASIARVRHCVMYPSIGTAPLRFVSTWTIMCSPVARTTSFR